MLSVLIPVKNSKYITHSLLSLLRVEKEEFSHKWISEILIIDSSDVPIVYDPMVAEIFAAIESVGISLYYIYKKLPLTEARASLIVNARSLYSMFLDADVVMQTGFSEKLFSYLEVVPFVAAQVISPANINGYENFVSQPVSELPKDIKQRPWLAQFIPSTQDYAEMDTAGTFALLFKSQHSLEVLKIKDWIKLLPREDMAFTKCLSMAYTQEKGLKFLRSGCVTPLHRVWHFGATRKTTWDIKTNAILEKAFAGAKTIEDLQKLVDLMNDGKFRC